MPANYFISISHKGRHMEHENTPITLTRDAIFDAHDIEEQYVYIPQWNGYVKIKTLTQKQSGDLRKRATRTDPVTRQQIIDNDMLEAMLFVEGVVEPKFTFADYARLQDKSMAAVSRVLRAVMDASGLSEDSVTNATKSATERSDAALRILSGEGVEDDTWRTP
jgi:hypothetical protein